MIQKAVEDKIKKKMPSNRCLISHGKSIMEFKAWTSNKASHDKIQTSRSLWASNGGVQCGGHDSGFRLRRTRAVDLLKPAVRSFPGLQFRVSGEASGTVKPISRVNVCVDPAWSCLCWLSVVSPSQLVAGRGWRFHPFLPVDNMS